jgi:hypothetical protein
VELSDYIEQIRKLQADLDLITEECNEWKEKFERIMIYQKQPRLPVRGLNSTLDCGGNAQGKATTQTYTTVGWDNQEDWK